MAKNTMWLTYEGTRRFEKRNGWNIFITKAICKNPECAFWRWAASKHEDQKDLYALWRDKKGSARKFENKYCLTQEEAIQIAREFCDR